MKKGLIIKLSIVVIVLVLSYCVFWFFKAGQSEKQINKFIADNSAYIYAGEISVSGFPVAQKITINDLKIIVPVNLVAKRQITIKQLQADSGIFSNNFAVNFTDAVKVQDLDSSGEVFDVEFVNKPEISVSLLDGNIAKLQYTDSGFKVLDAEKNIVNSSSGVSILSENSVDEAERHTNKINISFKDLEGYTVFDFYKNILDKKVVEGIKTEEIKVNINPATDQANIQQLTTPLSQDQVGIVNQPNGVASQQQPAQPQVAGGVNQLPSPSVAISGSVAANEALKNIEQVAKEQQPENAPTAPVDVASQPSIDSNTNNQQPTQTAEANIDFNAIKSNIVIDIVVTLTPSIKQEVADVPPADPTQVQELPVQHLQNIKINNFEMSNSLYKINVTGDIINASDDNYPSGGITVKVEKIANLVNHLKSQFKKLSQSKKSTIPSNGAVDLVNDQSQQNQTQNYDIFLNNISEKLTDVSNEIALKNSASKDDVAQFDVRREKNLEFLINEIPAREIIGKF